jgi:hypothetical protein
MTGLTLLTATGMRPDAWNICETLMQRQTYCGPVRWVIVDDGERRQPITFNRDGWKIDIIRPIILWSEGVNTQSRNLLAGLSVIEKYERVVIIEDDDYYNKNYLEKVDGWLKSADMVGEAPSRYYNASTGCGKVLQNMRHSSLCSTSVKGSALDLLRSVSKQNKKFIDITLWRLFKGAKKIFNTSMVVGIKGLPGRGGIGSGHNPTFGSHVNLKDWIGKDVEMYGKWNTAMNNTESCTNVA